ncbi:MAG: hypothetical protein KJP23_13285 [Deltaproteobacteria bacterium]|nr:hypothetical protein [Deltaproteobacteria bacterium]
MKKRQFLYTIIVSLWITAICLAADAPHQVALFKLNSNIAEVKDYVIMETALPIRYLENIEEVEIKPIAGFKSGLIAYVSCTAPDHIVRIKLKYKDSSKKFFKKLLKQIEQKYGKPDEYRGDPFHIVISWKWSFIDTDNNRISLTIQHNSMDTEEKMGNAIKLTMTSLIEEDRRCYEVKALDQREKLRQRKYKIMTPELSGWDLYVPR